MPDRSLPFHFVPFWAECWTVWWKSPKSLFELNFFDRSFYISVMAGSMQARIRPSLQADLQSDIHCETIECLLFGFTPSASALLSDTLPFSTIRMGRLSFVETLEMVVALLACVSGQLLLRCRGRPWLAAWGMLWALERAGLSHSLSGWLPSCGHASNLDWQAGSLLWWP